MDIWDFDVSEDLEYEEDYDNLEKLQAIDLSLQFHLISLHIYVLEYIQFLR